MRLTALRFGLRTLLRELRAGELSVLVAAIVVAVTAMTAVAFFTDRVGRAIRAQASAVLAADLELRSTSPIEPRYLEEARKLGLRAVESLSFPTMVSAGDSSSLAFLRAVSEGYPLRGELLVSDGLFGTPRRAAGVPAPGAAWAEPGLLGRMGIDVGAELAIGEGRVRITRVIEYQPGQTMGGMAALAPGLLVNLADVPAFNVIGPGSRVTYRQMFAGDPQLIARWRKALAPRLDSEVRLRGLEDAGEQINAAIDRAQRFLSLASLVTVILAAVATAMAARRYALRHLDSVALMKSLGATQRFIQATTLVQLTAVILGTALLGSLLGYVGQQVLVAIGGELLRIDLPPAAPLPGLLGLLTAVTITLGFALPHLLQLKNTAPIRVLRHDLPPPRLSAGLTYGVSIAALLGMVLIIVRDLELLMFISAGLLGVASVSLTAGWLLVRIVARFRGAAGVAWRYGLANISRRGAESVVQIVAFALSLMVLLLLSIVRGDLLEEWSRSLPEDLPNYFLLNMEPDDWPRIRAFFEASTGRSPQYLPFIRGRVTSINGKTAAALDLRNLRARNFLEREANFTWREELPPSNELRAGRWWQPGSDAREVSLEYGIARDLGVDVGDRLGFNVGGESFEAEITSLRFVEWDSMSPNFFVMLSPALGSELPQTYVASLYLPPDQRRLLNSFVRQFPGVTVLDLEVALGQVRMIIEKASLAVQYVFLFTLLAGLMVLLAAVQVTRDERRFESAILHTLGADRRTILKGVAIEFLVLGALAGLLAASGAGLVGWVLAERLFGLDYRLDPALWLSGLLAGGLIVGITGTLATRRAVSEPPVTVLREA